MVRLKKRGPVHKRGRETASTEREEENSAPTKEQKEESQGQAASESSSLTPASLPPDGDTVASPSSPTGVLDPYAFSAPRTVDGAAPPTGLHEVVDASVLRSNTETLKRGPKQATPTKPIEKKPKKPAKSISPLEKVLVKARFAAAEKIVIKSDPAPETTPAPAPSPSPAAAEGETTAPVQFGDHPVAQFVAVAAKTPRDGMTELCQQLEKHYSGDIYALVEHVVQYLQRQEVLKLDYMSLWNRMEFLLTMEKVSVLLPKALSAALVEGVASMETERLTTLALSLRFVVVLQANQKAMYRVPPSTWPAVTVYDATVNVLRLLCVGRSASRGEGHLPHSCGGSPWSRTSAGL
ncbi:hypothetical protein ADEAN_000028500 [Angomonas deanei]|uniref:Uncharacterized protein n=1 Tax=Angomonas deanei TaxID=59799 RepID=A0A7G2C2B1_9TRYP|nr:hypothetical protein ADEAN_000028500 [Angomonas deanei]